MESARACFQLLSDRVQLSSEEIEEREIVSEVIGAAERGAGQDDFIELARANKQMDVNWGTIPATNNFYVNPFQI